MSDQRRLLDDLDKMLASDISDAQIVQRLRVPPKDKEEASRSLTPIARSARSSEVQRKDILDVIDANLNLSDADIVRKIRKHLGEASPINTSSAMESVTITSPSGSPRTNESTIEVPPALPIPTQDRILAPPQRKSPIETEDDNGMMAVPKKRLASMSTVSLSENDKPKIESTVSEPKFNPAESISTTMEIDNRSDEEKPVPTGPFKHLSRFTSVGVDWPSREDNDYVRYMAKLYQAFRKSNVIFKDKQHICRDDADAQHIPFDDSPTFQQDMIQSFMHPQTPNKGLLIYHEVGTGKTRLTFNVLSEYRETHKIIWITTIRAKTSVKSQKSDFPYFYGDKTTKVSPFFDGSSANKHQIGKIALFTYQEFCNSLNGLYGYGGEKNKYGQYLKSIKGDPFANTLVVVDEAHKIFEDKNGADQNQGDKYYHRVAAESYQKSGEKSCRWMLLTATPMPAFEIPATQKEKPVIANVEGPLRLLNLLIPEKSDHFPTSFEAIKNLTALEFVEKAKGLISYFNPVNAWNKEFAPLEEMVTMQIRLPEIEKEIGKRLNETCKDAVKDKNKRKLLLGQCYRRRLHYMGARSMPSCEKETKSGQSCNGGVKKSQITTKDGKLDPKIVPQALKLVESIRQLDEDDMRKHGKTFKHIIYSSIANRTADIYVAALQIAGGFKQVDPAKRLNDLGIKYVNSSANARPVSYEFKFTSPTGEAVVDNEDCVYFMENNMKLKDLSLMQQSFNEHKLNNYGQIARIVVLGSGRKEAISLFDVKYVHTMEPQPSATDQTQITGRGRRRCGHVGLPDNERKLKVLVYGLTFGPHILKLRGPDEDNLMPLADIAYNAVKSDPAIAEPLSISEKLLSYLKYSAFDIVFDGVSGDQEIADVLAHLDRELNDNWQILQQIDQRAATTLMQVVSSNMGGQAKGRMTKAMLIEECNKRGIAPPKQSAPLAKFKEVCLPGVQFSGPKDCSKSNCGVAELKEHCKALGIKGYTKWKKAELMANCGSQKLPSVGPVPLGAPVVDQVPKAKKGAAPPEGVKDCTVEKCNRGDLVHFCKARGVTGYSKWKVDELRANCITNLPPYVAPKPQPSPRRQLTPAQQIIPPVFSARSSLRPPSFEAPVAPVAPAPKRRPQQVAPNADRQQLEAVWVDMRRMLHQEFDQVGKKVFSQITLDDVYVMLEQIYGVSVVSALKTRIKREMLEIAKRA